ncbi:MAG: prepilin-type N-terminal cleavage/methylation domain-containing protein [Kiritimatiellae bacterium]|nr:prepilin-type N-terminal cleavage/methylation domain-containing protein [Kiritimatiellia bacterium]
MFFNRTAKQAAARAGMTLIELIITLTILAAVASIAIVTLSDMGQTSRYVESSRRGEITQRAVIGEPGLLSRFVSDLGRYPMVLVNVPGESDPDIKEKLTHWYLAELYNIETADSVNGTPVAVYQPNEAAAVRSKICYVDADFNYDFNADGTSTPDDRPQSGSKLPKLQVAMKAGWDGPYLINQYEDFTDNYGKAWSINVATNTVKDLWDANWSTFRRASDGSVELEIAPQQDDQIRAMRSDFKVRADSNGLYGAGDFDSLEAAELYANEVEELTFPFYASHVFAELTVRLFIQGSTGVWLSAGSGKTPGPNTNSYDRARVMLYLPLCERAVEPQLCEIAAWCDTGNRMGTRYRSWDGSAYVNHYSAYALDGDGDGKFTTTAPDLSGEHGTIPDEIHTRCPVANTTATTGRSPWSNVSEVTFTKVPVGRRKLWGYAYSSSDPVNVKSGERYSLVQTVEIKAGHNLVDLYLTELEF